MSGTSDNDSNGSNNTTTTTIATNHNEQEWWLPSFPRWPFRTWTEIFFPRNDLISLLANRVVDGMHKNLQADGPVVQKLLQDHLPTNQESVRSKLVFYDSALDAIKDQRDMYLLGNNYSQKKKKDLKAQQQTSNVNNNTRPTMKMPRDATAQGYVQVVNLGAWFVPSSTIREALLPIVVSLPSGALRETITSTVANAIPVAQPSLDAAMKNAVMGVMQDPQIRQMIKSRTQKILRDDDTTASASATATTTARRISKNR